MNEEQEQSERQDRDMSIIKSHVAQISEHFETVQIIATRHDAEHGGTVMASWGEGNWYGRFGSIKGWITQQEEQTRIDQRSGDE